MVSSRALRYFFQICPDICLIRIQIKLTCFDGDPVETVEGDTKGPLLGPCEGERLGPDVGCEWI